MRKDPTSSASCMDTSASCGVTSDDICFAMATAPRTNTVTSACKTALGRLVTSRMRSGTPRLHQNVHYLNALEGSMSRRDSVTRRLNAIRARTACGPTRSRGHAARSTSRLTSCIGSRSCFSSHSRGAQNEVEHGAVEHLRKKSSDCKSDGRALFKAMCINARANEDG